LSSKEDVGSPDPNPQERVNFIVLLPFILISILITKCRHSYIFIFTYQKRALKNWKKELERDREHEKRIMSRLVSFLRKEEAQKECGLSLE
jgi:hypothetical protein